MPARRLKENWVVLLEDIVYREEGIPPGTQGLQKGNQGVSKAYAHIARIFRKEQPKELRKSTPTVLLKLRAIH